MADGSDSLAELVRARAEELGDDIDVDALVMLSDLLSAASQLLGELEAVHRPEGWSWAGFRIMLAAYLHGPLEPRRAARLAGVTRASISAVLNTLERDGYVERRRESSDRRVVTIVLTEAGRRAVRKGFLLQHGVEREWVAPLRRREVRTLTDLLARVVAARERDDGDEPRRAADV